MRGAGLSHKLGRLSRLLQLWSPGTENVRETYSTKHSPTVMSFDRRAVSLDFPGDAQTVSVPCCLLLLFLILVISQPVVAQQSLSDEAFVDRYVESVVDREWQHSMISRGANFPSINLEAEHRGELLVLLSKEVSPAAIQRHFGWSEQDLMQRLGDLEKAGVVRQHEPGQYVPTVAVMPIGRTLRHMPLFDDLIQRTAELVRTNAPAVREIYSRTEELAHIPFDRASLLILSNVLLDAIQIDYVEAQFLQAERPLRDGSRYYYSIREKPSWDARESFGIYGNQMYNVGRYSLGIYGNQRRSNPKNLIFMDEEGIAEVFGTKPDTLSAFKRQAISYLVRRAGNPEYSIPTNLVKGFERLGWMNDDQVLIPVFSERGWAALHEMAQIITEDLVALLDEYRPALQGAYQRSPFGRQISFEEYFIWWYHLYYTAVTDRLIADGLITVPAEGITSYVFVR